MKMTENPYIFPAKFLTHFMLPLYVILFAGMLFMGVGVLAGWIEVRGNRDVAWVLVLLPTFTTAWFVQRLVRR